VLTPFSGIDRRPCGVRVKFGREGSGEEAQTFDDRVGDRVDGRRAGNGLETQDQYHVQLRLYADANMPRKDREDLRDAVQPVRHLGGIGEQHKIDVISSTCRGQGRRQRHCRHDAGAVIRAGEAFAGGYGADDEGRRVRPE
jgi:hypothetical protein